MGEAQILILRKYCDCGTDKVDHSKHRPNCDYYIIPEMFAVLEQENKALKAKLTRYEELLRIARGSDFKWPESFKAQVDEALLKEGE